MTHLLFVQSTEAQYWVPSEMSYIGVFYRVPVNGTEKVLKNGALDSSWFLAVALLACVLQLSAAADKCSWYGEAFQGKPTASGEPFNKNDLTAAHRTLAFGIRVEVTDQETRKTVTVRINDRGPFVDGRILDLSEAAFKSVDDLDKGLFTCSFRIV